MESPLPIPSENKIFRVSVSQPSERSKISNRRALIKIPPQHVPPHVNLQRRRPRHCVALQPVLPQLSLVALLWHHVGQAIVKHQQLPLVNLNPVLVVRQWCRGNDGHPVIVVGPRGEVNGVVAVRQVGRAKGRLAHEVVQTVPYHRSLPRSWPAIRELYVGATSQKEVEYGGALVLLVECDDLMAKGLHRCVQHGEGREGVEPRPQRVQNGAEHRFAVRRANGIVGSFPDIIDADAPPYPWYFNA
mmetsp:Transcript_28834/g.61191  ORF Transcript_28834/g.61191 Transcript_28834/m.61191 type:complete len:245 (-) Transcript_28834:701-1435(-)